MSPVLRAGMLLLAFSFFAGPCPLAAQKTAAKSPAPKAAPKPKSDFKSHAEVVKGYERVVSTVDGAKSLFTLWKRTKDGHTLAEFDAAYESTNFFVALTVSSGTIFAGLQSGDRMVRLKRYGKRIAVIAPQMRRRANGDPSSKASVDRIFTDTVLADTPILSIGKRGGPVVDLDALLLGNARAFFGGSAAGLNRRIASLEVAKAFPQNVEIAYEAPISGGSLRRFHFSFSKLPKKTSYKPRRADERVGYFVTSYQDLAKYRDDSTWTRYINRWRLEKADPKLKLSPPKQPIVFYVEHTTPVRYRRFVRDGVLYWNKAFRAIGIDEAVVVHYQDAQSGAHMEKDPEDVRYNFVRWLNNDIGTAIGPSRVDPRTGQILDADIVLTDGWIRSFDYQFSQVLPKLAMEGFGQETVEWLHKNPSWDPEMIFATAHEREDILAARKHSRSQKDAARLARQHGGHHAEDLDENHFGADDHESGLCLAANSKAFDLAMARMHLEVLEMMKGNEKNSSGEDMLDGMPASFIGPLLADLVAHEVGHTLGLRHNFIASSIYSMAEVNSRKVKGKPFTSSVMDYNPININLEDGEIQGDYCMIDIGPYDMWAIEYGYTLDDKALPKILARCVEPGLTYLTDEDTSGPDPHARRYDFAKDPLDYAKNQMRLAKFHRKNLLSRFVQKGDSWSKASRGYNITLSFQVRSLSMMANWLGGAHTRRHKKGDSESPPIQAVAGDKQRAALAFLINSSFEDDAFGLDPKLMQHLSKDKWFDSDAAGAASDVTFPIHDRVMGIQSSVLTMMLNPTTLRRVLDNESLSSEDKAFSLAEMMRTISKAAWTELDASGAKSISSLRRNLQTEHLNRLIDLSYPKKGSRAAAKTIASLARMHLRRIDAAAKKRLAGELDDYSRAHLEDVLARASQALDAQLTLNLK